MLFLCMITQFTKFINIYFLYMSNLVNKVEIYAIQGLTYSSLPCIIGLESTKRNNVPDDVNDTNFRI